METSNYNKISILFGIFLTLQVAALKIASTATFCGTDSADPEKTCISIRLPWQGQPIYFCTDKSNIKYRNNCGSVFETTCGIKPVDKDKLLVATPWDCCPLTSTPDYCVNKPCPVPPFNRTCSITNQTTTSGFHHSGLYEECCPKYFCEVDTKPEDCNYKKLHAECMPPQNKTNCFIFRDKYGCCDKYQCDEDDSKPGKCPEYNTVPYQSAPNIENEMNYTNENGNDESVSSSFMTTTTDTPSTEGSSTERSVTSRKRYPYRGGAYYPSMNDGQSCIGDFTCPGEEKCCPESYGIYGITPHKMKHAVHGYCTKPVFSAAE